MQTQINRHNRRSDFGERQAIDNARVLERDQTWQVGQPARHLHDHDAVAVFAEGGTITFTAADGRVETRTYAPGDTRFITQGTIDLEEAIAGKPRAVTIELNQQRRPRVGLPKKISASEFDKPLRNPVARRT